MSIDIVEAFTAKNKCYQAGAPAGADAAQHRHAAAERRRAGAVL